MDITFQSYQDSLDKIRVIENDKNQIISMAVYQLMVGDNNISNLQILCMSIIRAGYNPYDITIVLRHKPRVTLHINDFAIEDNDAVSDVIFKVRQNKYISKIVADEILSHYIVINIIMGSKLYLNRTKTTKYIENAVMYQSKDGINTSYKDILGTIKQICGNITIANKAIRIYKEYHRAFSENKPLDKVSKTIQQQRNEFRKDNMISTIPYNSDIKDYDPRIYSSRSIEVNEELLIDEEDEDLYEPNPEGLTNEEIGRKLIDESLERDGLRRLTDEELAKRLPYFQ